MYHQVRIAIVLKQKRPLGSLKRRTCYISINSQRFPTYESDRKAAEMPGSTQKICTGCNNLISVAYKTCPHCKQVQPYKAKVASLRCNFQNKKSEWKASLKKNNNRTVVLNSSHVLLDKLAALDFFPVLLLGKKSRGTLVADVILGGDYILEHDLLQKVKLMYEAVLKSKSFCTDMKLCNLETLVTQKNVNPQVSFSLFFISMQKMSITFSRNRIKQHVMALLLKETIW
ncbi:uncharacterized protein LOC125275820 [Megalobrama amblycephala]|uniref:uncharacterized protein LOC125275820 n=1 Tax=Megalobrama amblycephala TaxID=75352 RepID=UPI00201422C0|nr:uncharacterized protein LOC125275820 [Megalobrama amblycephala]